MKKKLLSALLVATCVVSMAACGSNKTEKEAKDDKIIVGTEAGFAPYEYMKGNEVVGIDMDIAKAIADDMGKELEIKNMDFDGALAAVASGKVSHEYVNSTEVIVVNGESPAVTPAGAELSGSDLDGKVVAVQQGNIADIWVSNEENCKPKEVKRYTKFAQAAEDLKNNKVDCIVMDQYPAEQLVASNGTLKILDGVLFEDKYAIAVKKGNQELLDKINKVIDQLIEDGKIEEFTANHTQK